MSTRSNLYKIINDGVLKAELNTFFQKELCECGYAGIELRCAPTRYEIILKVTKTQMVLENKGQRVKELTSILCQRYNWESNQVDIYVEKVANHEMSAPSQAESIKFKLLNGIPVRKAADYAIRMAIEKGAKGAEVIISGKIRGQRAKAMKFTSGLMIHSGQPSKEFVEEAVRSVELRQGVLGVKVKIMKSQDPTGKQGPVKPIPDQVVIHAPKEEKIIVTPYSDNKVAAVAVAEE